MSAEPSKMPLSTPLYGVRKLRLSRVGLCKNLSRALMVCFPVTMEKSLPGCPFLALIMTEEKPSLLVLGCCYFMTFQVCYDLLGHNCKYLICIYKTSVFCYLMTYAPPHPTRYQKQPKKKHVCVSGHKS